MQHASQTCSTAPLDRPDPLAAPGVRILLSRSASDLLTSSGERARHCYLPKDQGPCFAWNDHHAMHTSCGTAGEVKSAANREKRQSEAGAAVGDDEALTYSQLVAAIVESLTVGERTAKSRVTTWLSNGITRKNAVGNHTLIDP